MANRVDAGTRTAPATPVRVKSAVEGTEVQARNLPVLVTLTQALDALGQVFGGDSVADGQRRLDESRQVVTAADDLAVHRVGRLVVVRRAELGDAQIGPHPPPLDGPIGEFVLHEVEQLGMPVARHQRHQALFHLNALVGLDDLLEAFHRRLHRGGDVSRQYLRKVVEQAGPEAVVQTPIAGPQLPQAEIGEDGHDQHVAQHRGLRDARGL